MSTFVLSPEDLREITSMIKSQMNLNGVTVIRENSSAILGFSKTGDPTGRSEFWLSDGSIVRVTWKLSTGDQAVTIDWERTFTPDETIPAVTK